MALPDDEQIELATNVWNEVKSAYSPTKFGSVFKVKGVNEKGQSTEFEFKICMIGTQRFIVLWNGIIIERGLLHGSKW
jgi:hypothetical protein